MSQEQDRIEALSAENRRLVWETERLNAEIKRLKRQVDVLNDQLVTTAAKYTDLLEDYNAIGH
jgi:predicted nuclease with TOPRIM domain